MHRPRRLGQRSPHRRTTSSVRTLLFAGLQGSSRKGNCGPALMDERITIRQSSKPQLRFCRFIFALDNDRHAFALSQLDAVLRDRYRVGNGLPESRPSKCHQRSSEYCSHLEALPQKGNPWRRFWFRSSPWLRWDDEFDWPIPAPVAEVTRSRET